jgi:hypothetical protein
MPPPIEEIAKLAGVRHGIETELRKLVLDGEEEEARFRRRMHLHLCLIAIAGAMTLLSLTSVVDASSVAGLMIGLNCTQEIVDYLGRF